MKRIALYICLLLVMTSCKTNNGDIGRWYGLWTLERMAVDGTDVPAVTDEGWTNFAFQNDVVLITRTDRLGDVDERFGTWTETDGFMDLDYGHRDDLGEGNQYIYKAPEWLYFIPDGVTRCRILSARDCCVILQQTDAQGRVITYCLKKQN